MRTIRYIEFNDEERDVLERALMGHSGAIVEPGKRPGEVEHPVHKHLTRIRDHREPYDHKSLVDLGRVLDLLIEEWAPFTTPEAWRAVGAPGADDAVEGLARERSLAVARAESARAIVELAMRLADQRSPRRVAA